MVKIMHASVWIALVTSAGSFAAPPAAPAPVAGSAAVPAAAALPGAPNSLERRIALAQRFVALTAPADVFMEGVENGIASSYLRLSGAEADSDAAEKIAAEAAVVAKRLEPLFAKRMPVLLEAYAKAHANHYSEAELTDLIAFASSPTGRRYLSTAMDVLEDPNVIGAQQLIMGDIMPEMEGIARERCAKMAEIRVAAGDTKARCPLQPDQAAG